ncbi:DNA-directed RNA polymerase subunit beta' [Mycoplasmoides gallisepticum]|uniref:DNA-directed RNA polymerase subunit beta' n=1 Tax=Mycoplasmoides gallisepticum TaxID=2096 RepID=A0AB36DT43_MYCGL|nr:DNA-directed RNA polymerase subunit beta' [Mycoplasmoides gallisepticum]OBU78322.1 DNA-directed RNA polymerase subunit beta' [Mycoplasmoides gallisepticum]OBU79135.1 DNA-directed RNA polymerase subunit beta' [Mycoplasmoides gallisepticum]OBU79559.1 DNA-directed RNA polymerase subunit beta' [Mycoplasmoides gallisepticum]OBU79995.1 DNA-directed RNA polymerase subunit beta' [Mycoplasmoides gallisepticum]OBU80369.1 DNA-directed RNA polymerase subunit beta' [Mycoplasmoides gallisepticum]
MDKLNKKNKNKRIRGLQISIASAEEMRSWSHGEVKKPETINYKSLKPETDGLFDEAIFGPVKDFECACGKYKKIKHRGRTCEKCGVEITESIVRRERMGHIDLAVPVAHIWMTKELPSPSKISLVLDVSYKEVEEVVYFVNYIILNPGNSKNPVFKFKEVVDLSGKGSKSARIKLRKVLREIKDKHQADKHSIVYKRASDYYNKLKESHLPFSIDEVAKFIETHTGIRLGIGAEAILELLEGVDLQKEYDLINEELNSYSKDLKANKEDQKVKRALRRLETIKWLKESGIKASNMILKVIPVTPPDTRPIIQLDGARFTTSDINNFYRRIIIRNERLKKIIELRAPSVILNNEKRMLQEVVDALFDNASRKKPITAKDKRPLKSLTDRLKGKQGLFRQNLLGKRVDYSGRSVIVIGPELKMYEVGIPAPMILKLFKPFIIRELIMRFNEDGQEIKPIAPNIKIAEQMIAQKSERIWDIVDKVIKERPVLLNRAPTLHRLGIQAFEPKIVDGKAIRLHPLVTTAFNADFDGDQMAVHVPISKEAVAEARAIMLASWHILGPKDGKPVATPTQDMVLGNYYLTTEKRNEKGEGLIFSDFDQVILAYEAKQVSIHALIGLSTKCLTKKPFAKQGIVITTVGKAIMNSIMPEEMAYLNDGDNLLELDESNIVFAGEDFKQKLAKRPLYKPFGKKTLSKIIEILYKNFPLQKVPQVLDKIKEFGFKYSTLSSTTISVFDIPRYDNKQEYITKANEMIAKLKHMYQKGLLTDDERYTKVIRLWADVKDNVSKDIKEIITRPEYKENSIVVIADSGARGNISNFTQLFGMRGLMSKSYNYDQKIKSQVIRDTIEVPIKHSFIEGLTINEYFNSSYGARKGMTDIAMKTSKSGYMTRKLVDAAQEVIINDSDCNTNKGIVVSTITNSLDGGVVETLSERIVTRYTIDPIYDEKTKELLVDADTLITSELAEKIAKANVTKALIRSPIYCQSTKGLCQKCFGNDLTTNDLVQIGTAIGVIAAQSIGEPGTQLTMRTFHTGGTANEGNITQGFERLKQIFDVVSPKEWELATIAENEGVVESITSDATARIIRIKTRLEAEEYRVPFDAVISVNPKDVVYPGSKLTEGSIDIKHLLRVAGIETVRQYFLEEVQKVYRLQGIEIADKYVEVTIRQLTNKLQVIDVGDSDYFVGQTVDINKFRKEVTNMLIANKRPPVAINQVFGLDEAPAKTGSFLSAASFQDTKKILTDAAVKNQIDYLVGLKENVILGNLIPAGTGFMSSEEIIKAGEEALEKEY